MTLWFGAPADLDVAPVKDQNANFPTFRDHNYSFSLRAGQSRWCGIGPLTHCPWQ